MALARSASAASARRRALPPGGLRPGGGAGAGPGAGASFRTWRGARARALAFVGTEESLQRLANQLAVPGRVRESLRGITDIQDSALIPLLFNLLPELTDDQPTYGPVLTALQNQEWRGVIAGLATFLKSGDETGVRTGARIMTVLTRSPELGKPLREALADAKEVETIEAGLIALGSSVMQPDQHHKFFTKHLNQAEPEIRALAIR